ncbi:hypothetical protein GCM10022238_31220 [Gordonia hankookensis]
MLGRGLGEEFELIGSDPPAREPHPGNRAVGGGMGAEHAGTAVGGIAPDGFGHLSQGRPPPERREARAD